MKKLILLFTLISLMSFKAEVNNVSLKNKGEKITLTIDAEKTYLRGEEVSATFYIENNSDKEIYILKPSFGTTNLDFFSAEIECGLQFASTSDGTTFTRSIDDLVLIKPNTKEKFTISGDHYTNLTCAEGPEDKFKLQLIYKYENDTNYWVEKYKKENPESYAAIEAKVYKGIITSKMTTIAIRK